MITISVPTQVPEGEYCVEQDGTHCRFLEPWVLKCILCNLNITDFIDTWSKVNYRKCYRCRNAMKEAEKNKPIKVEAADIGDIPEVG